MEVFSQLLTLAKIILTAISVISMLVIVAASIEFYFHRGLNKAKEEEMRSHIMHSLIAILLAIVIYLFLSAIGPAFNLLFTR